MILNAWHPSGKRQWWRKIFLFDIWCNVPFTFGHGGFYAFLIHAYQKNRRGIGIKLEFDKRGSAYRRGWDVELALRLWWRDLSIGFDWDPRSEEEKEAETDRLYKV